MVALLFHRLQLLNIIVHNGKQECIPQNVVLLRRVAAANYHESLLDWDPEVSQIISGHLQLTILRLLQGLYLGRKMVLCFLVDLENLELLQLACTIGVAKEVQLGWVNSFDLPIEPQEVKFGAHILLNILQGLFGRRCPRWTVI